MTYTPILNAEVDAESPITDLLLTRLRDNPIAIADGDSGAPRINPIGAMAHQGAFDAVGTYAFAIGTGVFVQEGNTLSGSVLRTSTTDERVGANALSGTWRVMGQRVGSLEASLVLRIS